MPPRHLSEIKKRLPDFTSWLHARGAVVHQPTNPYEVMRFDAAHGVGVIYRKADNILTWPEDAADAWNAFLRGSTTWRPTSKVERITKGARKRRAKVRCLIKRDGALCIYCGDPLTEETATIEHVVPLGHGGPDRLINMALACADCNHGLGDLPAAKKIAYALAKRG